MKANVIEKLLDEVIKTGGTYVEFVISENNVTFVSNCGSRKRTRNYRQTEAEIMEDERILISLNDRSLLFSNRLDLISYTLSDGRTAVIKKSRDEEFFTIQTRKASEKKEKTTEYVCFTSDKEYRSGIAFAIKQLKNGNHQIVPCEGTVMNGTADIGVSTDLLFVIGGDFQSIVGSLDVETGSNKKAIEQVSEVLTSSMKRMLRLGLLGMPLFSVLPSTMDEDTTANMILVQAVKRACNSSHMFRNRVGTVVSRSRIAYGTDEVTALFPQEIAEIVLGERYWIEPCVLGSREEYFLVDLGIPQYDRERFLKELFAEENYDDCSKILEKQNDNWLRKFYLFCSGPLADNSIKRKVLLGLKNIPSIRDSSGKMRFPNEVTVAIKVKPASKKSLVVKPEIISPSGNDDEYSDQLREFFLNDLKISEYSQRPEMERLVLALINDKQSYDKTYARKMLMLADYDKAFHGEIAFNTYDLFPYESTKGIRRSTANNLVIGKPYIREGDLLASATERKSLWKGFEKYLSTDELEIVLEFVERSGAIGKPKIIMRSAREHSDFFEKLYLPGKQKESDSDFDYTIPGLTDILKKRSLQLSKLVWRAILDNAYGDEVLRAEYSINKRRIVNHCDSSLLIELRERVWVPGKDGKLYKPDNIEEDDISDDLVFDKENCILKALEFGEGKRKRKQEIGEMERIAAREHLRLIPEKEYQEFLTWKEQKRKK